MRSEPAATPLLHSYRRARYRHLIAAADIEAGTGGAVGDGIARAGDAGGDIGEPDDGVVAGTDGVIRIALTATVPPALTASATNDGWTPSGALQRYLKRAESG